MGPVGTRRWQREAGCRDGSGRHVRPCAHSVASDSAAPRAVARQAPLSMGFSRQEHWSGSPCPPPGDLPDPGMTPVSLVSAPLAGGFLSTGATWEAQQTSGKQVTVGG